MFVKITFYGALVEIVSYQFVSPIHGFRGRLRGVSPPLKSWQDSPLLAQSD
jgi:hypothetical protein